MTLPFSQPSWFSSEDFASMTLNNVAGSLLEVIRGCAVTGYNPHPVTSIVVNAGVAVASCAAHGYTATYGKLLLIAGASEPLLNGRKQPTAVLTNSFTFPAPGVADGTYTGTISARRAPLGWVEAHTGTNVAIFARSAPEATAMLLRVDDSNVTPASATSARVLMLEAATDANTYTGPTPTTARLAGGQHWLKGAPDATAKPWVLVGDGRRFYFFVMNTGSGTDHFCHAFGDFTSYRAADAYACFLAGQVAASALNSSSIQQSNVLAATAVDAAFLAARASSQIGVGVRLNANGFVPAGASNAVAGGAGFPVYPSPVDNGCVIHAPVLLSEDNLVFKHPVRGELPGVAHPLGGLPFPNGTVIPSVVGSDRQFLAVRTSGVNEGAVAAGQILIDITGPW